jgi:hypothetical protein
MLMEIYDPTIFTVEYKGRNFMVPSRIGNISTYERNSTEKHKITQVIVNNEFVKGKTVCIEPFGACGFSGYMLSEKAKIVYIMEKEKDIYDCLEKNIGDLPNVKLYHSDNIPVLEELTLAGVKADFIDLDPFSNFHEQLPFVPYLMEKGILMLTNGEHSGIARFGKLDRYGDMKRYQGKNAYKWADEILVPYLNEELALLDFKIWYYYVFPTSIRLVCTVGGYQLKKETVRFLGTLPKFRGEYAYLERGRGTASMF